MTDPAPAPTSNEPTSNEPTSNEPTSNEPTSNEPTSNDHTVDDPDGDSPEAREEAHQRARAAQDADDQARAQELASLQEGHPGTDQRILLAAQAMVHAKRTGNHVAPDDRTIAQMLAAPTAAEREEIAGFLTHVIGHQAELTWGGQPWRTLEDTPLHANLIIARDHLDKTDPLTSDEIITLAARLRRQRAGHTTPDVGPEPDPKTERRQHEAWSVNRNAAEERFQAQTEAIDEIIRQAEAMTEERDETAEVKPSEKKANANAKRSDGPSWG